MRNLRFLLTRRWVLLLVVVVTLAGVAWRLGEWQFDRREDRLARNATIERNERSAPVPVTDVLAPGSPVAAEEEWKPVSATGTYAVEDTVVVRYRTRNGAAGVDVVVPLELSDGSSVLVDRGWLRTDNRGTTPDDVPTPPPGEVTIEGWVRADATGDSTAVTDQSTRAISSERIGEALGREVLTGFVELRAESPDPDQALEPVQLPEQDGGPHFFYGLQWWFFAILALFGFGYLAYDEARGGRGMVRGSRRPKSSDGSDASDGSDGSDGSEGSQHPAVDRKHDARQE